MPYHSPLDITAFLVVFELQAAQIASHYHYSNCAGVIQLKSTFCQNVKTHSTAPVTGKLMMGMKGIEREKVRTARGAVRRPAMAPGPTVEQEHETLGEPSLARVRDLDAEADTTP